MAKDQQDRWKIWIDTGGTFTDCLAHSPEGIVRRVKVLSDSTLRGTLLKPITPTHWEIRQNWHIGQMDLFKGYTIQINPTEQRTTKITAFDAETSSIHVQESLPEHLTGVDFTMTAFEEAPILAARLVTATPLTNTLPSLEMRLGTTRGTNALLERKGANTTLLVTKGFKDLLAIGTQQRPDIFSLHIEKPAPYYTEVLEVTERLDAQGKIIQTLSETDKTELKKKLSKSAPESVAIALLHSYVNATHEEALAETLREAGFSFVSTSSSLTTSQKILPRAQTALINAYLAPIIHEYLARIQQHIPQGDLKVMSSAGGLADANLYHPKDSLLSGPAGGIVGAATILRQVQQQQPGFQRLLTVDMGGTSTDVSRYDGEFDYRFLTQVGDAEIISPALAIETVAAGGGSICQFKNGTLAVGPESASAYPGPACYGQGGPLTITDVNLLLGRLTEDNFGIPINPSYAQKALDEVKSSLQQQAPHSALEDEELLLGFLRIANEKMTATVRSISVKKGFDPADHTLLAFGGAGGQHACEIASLLGIKKIIVPQDAGLLSAYGMGQAVLERFSTRQVLQPFANVQTELSDWISLLTEDATAQCRQEGYSDDELEVRFVKLFLRFQGQESTLEIDYTSSNDIITTFQKQYEALFGHWLDKRVIELESIKVVVSTLPPPLPASKQTKSFTPKAKTFQKSRTRQGWQSVPVYAWDQLNPGAMFTGPALLTIATATLWLESGWELHIDGFQNALLYQQHKQQESSVQAPEAIQLALFTNRFSSIASGMGALLERTSFSVNVKERLDFSCALLDADGELIVNAPHIPVHLGSLGICVRSVRDKISLEAGDVVITNHPGYGGSHLPDVTLISPIFVDQRLIGYVANRAHHAEIGGTRPGSMPTQATTLEEEGVVIAPTYLVRKGESQWDDIRKLFTESSYPTRNVEENMADLNGGLASIRWGVQSLQQLAEQYGTDRIQQYMQRLKEQAAQRMRTSLERLVYGPYKAGELLDDGSKLQVLCILNDNRTFTIDFSGSSPTHPRNLNATPAIVHSAVIYVLRLLLDQDLPLNEGLLQSIKIILPDKTLLNPLFDENPADCPAVVGGNTETSQRLVDTLLKALGMAACSQGTMNNVLFGNEHFGYYETIGGGTGAGPEFSGTHAIHQHMTNTRITDPEVLEFRYPVRLDEFSVRAHSGGTGRWCGGNGIVRKLTFLSPVSLTVLTQHRQVAPYGLQGGQPGKIGKQWIIRKDGSEEPLQGIDQAEMKVGDQFIILTPGGGGFGENR
ncbi:MAG: hydantoinase B/oxoprolinase family protein [Cyclobacteriaceae bacterium]